MPEGPTLADLGEWELIRRLGAFAPPGQFDDDAALVSLRRNAADPDLDPDQRLVINTDVLVEGIHFSDLTTRAADVGWRAAAANLSDLAAMGCQEVLGLTVGLVAPASTPWSWVEGVYGGLIEVLSRHGGVLLGGDCSGGNQRLLAVTALGRMGPAGPGPIRRTDGRPGDGLVSTGPHGLSRLGLALLRNDPTLDRWPWSELAEELQERAITAHRRPRPRFDAVAALAVSRPADQPWRVAGCDSSDGLVAAIAALASASGCAAQLERGALPIDAAMADLPMGEVWCLGGGEDFELVLALDPTWAQALIRQLPGASLVGELVEGPPAGGVQWAGSREPIATGGGGFRHFQIEA